MRKPPAFLPLGIHPVGPCLDRLFHQEHIAIPRLLACTFAPEGLKVSAIEDNPQHIEDRQKDLKYSAAWELQRYGCILLAFNPYSAITKAKGKAA
jgi:hypothetical protein